MAETGKRVLLVENDPVDLAHYRAVLEATGLGFDVVSTGSIAFACELLRESRFELILLDLFLEDEFGIDSFVRVFSQAPEVPIVILTAPADEELAAQAVSAGAASFLTKRPGNVPEAARILSAALERSPSEIPWPAGRVVDGRAAFLASAERYVNVAMRAGKRLLLFAATINQGGGIEASYGPRELQRASDDAAEMLRLTFRASDLLARLEPDRFAGLAIMNLEDNGPEVVAARLREVTEAGRARSSRPYDLSLRFRFKSIDPDEIVTVEELALEADRMLRAIEA